MSENVYLPEYIRCIDAWNANKTIEEHGELGITRIRQDIKIY